MNKIRWYRRLWLRIRYLGGPTLEEYGTKVVIMDTMSLEKSKVSPPSI